VLAAWVLALVTAVAALHIAGRVLPSPPLGSPAEWLAWLRGRDPLVVAFSAVRLFALGVAWYCLVVTVAGAALRAVAATDLAAALDRVTLPALRRVLVATMTAGITTAALSPVAAGAVTRSVVAVQAAGPTTTAPPPPDASVALTMHELPGGGQAPPPPLPSPTPGAVAGPTGPVVGSGETTWTVQPGDCFWSIAEQVLTQARGRGPTAGEILPYWRRLIDANRHLLGDPKNPDLVFPGQVFTLPEASGP
jgi:nucleoid-associated protein YgaU